MHCLSISLSISPFHSAESYDPEPQTISLSQLKCQQTTQFSLNFGHYTLNSIAAKEEAA